MQLVDGKSLRQLLDEQKRLSPELTIHIGTCVARRSTPPTTPASSTATSSRATSSSPPTAGCCSPTSASPRASTRPGDDLTSDNIMMGTAKYLSPEQVRGRKLDGRADLYSLGLVLYECLAGRVPFLGETDADTALARLQRDPPTSPACARRSPAASPT